MAVEQIEAPADRLAIRAEIAASPQRVFDAFIEPDLLARWWTPQAELDLRPGGAYRFSWPAQGWHLFGRYTAVEPPHRLVFSWTWEHEPHLPERLVEVTIEPAPGGSTVTLVHSPYGDSEVEQADRESHRQGWLHFLGRLGEALSTG